MSDDALAKLRERDKSMRKARDEVLRRVGTWLTEREFARAGAGHFTRRSGDFVCHVGFQKLSSGRAVRVMCHLSGLTEGRTLASGPMSDSFAGHDSPNKMRYQFGWSTREADIARCASEYCRYVNDVVFEWFNEQITQRGRA
jgi:hypothetical protein